MTRFASLVEGQLAALKQEAAESRRLAAMLSLESPDAAADLLLKARNLEVTARGLARAIAHRAIADGAAASPSSRAG